MRRFIAYIAMTSTLILGTAALIAPTMINMDSDVAYANGKTLYFRTGVYNENSNTGTFNSFLGDLDNADGHLKNNEGTYIVEEIADTMRSRLNTWGISDYDISIEGVDTISVSLRSKQNNDDEYTRLANYLSFSGQKYELDASDTSGSSSGDDESGSYEHNDDWETMLEGKTAEVILLDKDSYQVPVVIIPIDEKYKTSFLDLLDYCKDNTVEEETDSSGSVTTEGKTCNVVLWANRLETDLYSNKSDANVGNKIIFEHAATDDQCVYYKDSDDDKEYPYFQMIPSSAATSSGTYDPSKAQEASDAANYLCNMFNASSYEYKNIISNTDKYTDDNRYTVSYLYSKDINASTDSLISLGNWSISPAMGRTMISVLVGLALLAVLLGLFNRILAMQEIASIMVSGMATLGTFVAFGTQFNIAALIALIATALITLFGSIFYASRLKNEIHKGRTLKKASIEASKASTWAMVDSGIIAIIIGIFLYVLGGTVCRAGGVMLTLGGFYSIFTNLIITKFSCWLLCNDSNMQHDFPKMIGVKKENIPNLMADEKQKYFGPYEKKDFSKGKKWAYAVSGAMILAGIGAMIGFGVTNNGNIYNDAAYREKSTVLRIQVKSTDSARITVDAFSSAGDVYTENSTDHSDILHQYRINGKEIGSMVSSFNISEKPTDVYETPDEGDEGTHYYYFYYEAKLNCYLDDSENATFTIEEWDQKTNAYVTSSINTLNGNDSLASAIAEIAGSDTSGDYASVYFNTLTPQTLTPYVGDVCLALGVGIAVCFAYLLLRYKPSRAIAMTLIGISSIYIALGFFVYTRISVSPVVALGMILGIIVTFLSALFILCRDKELFRENHEKDKTTLANRIVNLNKAVSYDANNVFIFGICAEYLALVGFAIGPVPYSSAYLCAVLAIAFGLILTMVTIAPITSRFATWFSHIHMPKFKKKKKEGTGQIMKKKRGGEPEEAIFIGIND